MLTLRLTPADRSAHAHTQAHARGAAAGPCSHLEALEGVRSGPRGVGGVEPLAALGLRARFRVRCAVGRGPPSSKPAADVLARQLPSHVEHRLWETPLLKRPHGGLRPIRVTCPDGVVQQNRITGAPLLLPSARGGAQGPPRTPHIPAWHTRGRGRYLRGEIRMEE